MIKFIGYRWVTEFIFVEMGDEMGYRLGYKTALKGHSTYFRRRQDAIEALDWLKIYKIAKCQPYA